MEEFGMVLIGLAVLSSICGFLCAIALLILLFRIPGAYFASVLFPETLGPMGMAAPAGSLFSAVLCLFLYYRMQRQGTALN